MSAREINAVGISISGNLSAAKLARLQDALRPERVDGVAQLVAAKTLRSCIIDTPQRFGASALMTGRTVRNSWEMTKRAPGHWAVWNAHPALKFLEYGTRAHGPRQIQGPVQPYGGVNRRSGPGALSRRALFIPLTKKAAMANRTIYAKVVVKGQRAIVVRGGIRKTGGYAPKTLIYGVDYVLAKWVKGITARHIVQRNREKCRDLLKAEAKAYIVRVLAG